MHPREARRISARPPARPPARTGPDNNYTRGVRACNTASHYIEHARRRHLLRIERAI
jgi:hypothetical protein